VESTRPTPGERPTQSVAFTRAAFAGATTMFVVFGTTASLYGPLLVTFSHHFRVSLPAAGAVVSVHFVGAFFGVPAAWAALQRFPAGAVLAGSLAALATGAAGAALAHGFYELLASVAVIGLGSGGIDFSLNSLLVRIPAVGRAHRLSVANAGYGIGSIVGPLLVIVAHQARYPLVFTAVAIAALCLTVTTGGVGAPRMSKVRSRAQDLRRRTSIGVFVGAYVLYVATETSAAGWIAPQLHRVGYSQSTGALATAGFWLGLTFGRLLAGPAHRRVSDRWLVLCSLALATVLAMAASVDALAPIAYPLVGLSLALVYPMGLIWFTNLNLGDGSGMVILMLMMMAGGVIGPALTGVAVSVAGIHAVPACIAVFAASYLVVFLVAHHFRPPPDSEPARL